jgi:hypothetical protein
MFIGNSSPMFQRNLMIPSSRSSKNNKFAAERLYYIHNEWVRRAVIAIQEETSWGMCTEMHAACGMTGKWNKAEEGKSTRGNARERSANLTNGR